jgi:hypothetical protein
MLNRLTEYNIVILALQNIIAHLIEPRDKLEDLVDIVNAFNDIQDFPTPPTKCTKAYWVVKDRQYGIHYGASYIELYSGYLKENTEAYRGELVYLSRYRFYLDNNQKSIQIGDLRQLCSSLIESIELKDYCKTSFLSLNEEILFLNCDNWVF